MKNIIRNIIVTGSNKGIGYGIVQNLAQKQGWNIIMACRNIELAKQSQKQLLGKFPKALIEVEQLDVSNEQSISNFIEIVKNKYKYIDILINNAGVYKKDALGQELTKTIFATNFYGTITFTEALIPYISSYGKIIIVASMAGKFIYLKNQAQVTRFKNPNLTKEELFSYIQEFQVAVAQGNYIQKGFSHKSSYAMSKLGINLYTRILSKRKDILNRSIQVYSLCPGYVNTDMSSHKGPLTIQEGALTPVYLAELPFELNLDLQGQFFERSALSSL